MLRFCLLISVTVMLLCTYPVQPGWSQSIQPYDEAQTAYLANLARRDHGLPPLRWNRELTQSARWFAWDSVENRPEPYCGHEDSQGGTPGDRARTAGYKGSAGSENAYCSYLSPEQAIAGWLESAPHAENLLSADHREIGHGYYQREDRGYVVQDFGHDIAYPPVIIENEALTISSTQVNLYIYSSAETNPITGMGSAVDMMIANTPAFENSTWEPYTTEKVWDLLPGEGWKTVYVKTRDRFHRTMTVTDTIYLGADIPYNELGDAQASTTRSMVQIAPIDTTTWPLIQFSPGWLIDDSFATFELLWGNGEQVDDADTTGGTAFRLYPGDGESYTWVWTTSFIQDVPLVAYFRLKVDTNTSSDEVGRISITGGGNNYDPLVLHGTDFAQAGKYQEFALPFTFSPQEDTSFLIFHVWRTGSTDIYVDSVSIFTEPQAVDETIAWQFPDGNYRGQSIWMRFSDNDGRFSPMQEALIDETVNPAPAQSNIFLPFILKSTTAS